MMIKASDLQVASEKTLFSQYSRFYDYARLSILK